MGQRPKKRFEPGQPAFRVIPTKSIQTHYWVKVSIFYHSLFSHAQRCQPTRCLQVSKMEFSPSSRRARRPPPPKNSDLYSTVVIKDDAASKELDPDPKSSDIYATMVYKDDVVEDEEDSLPPLLKRLPKDFGGGGYDVGDSDDDDLGGSSSGTMIVKTNRKRSNYTERNVLLPYAKPRGTGMPTWDKRSPESKNVKEENVGDFSTFVVRGRQEKDEDEDEDEVEEGEFGTVMRSGGAGGGSGGGTMRRAVESMQKVGEVGMRGNGRQRKSGGGSNSEGIGQTQVSRKMSSSSIPDSVIREDPFTKYELLHELGKDLNFTLNLLTICGCSHGEMLLFIWNQEDRLFCSITCLLDGCDEDLKFLVHNQKTLLKNIFSRRFE